MRFPATEVILGTVLADAAHFNTANDSILSMIVKNTGSAAFTAFEVHARPAGEAHFNQVNGLSVPVKTTDFTVSDLHILYASAEPMTLAAGESALIYINVSALTSITLRACGLAGAKMTTSVGTFD